MTSYGNIIVHDQLDQGSEEWFAMRRGKATASNFSKIITAAKGQMSKSADAYMRVIAREELCDDPHVFMGNKHTEWGNDTEPEARDCFAKTLGRELELREVGFITRADGAPLGLSPDGIIFKDGFPFQGLEIKCPQVDTHVEYVMNGTLPDSYKQQVHGSMAISGLSSWWFMSYFPGLKPLIIRVDRDEYTEKMLAGLEEFGIKYASVRREVINAIRIS